MPANQEQLLKNWGLFWLLFCTIALFFWRSSERCLTKARSIQAESLKQFSCRTLCQPEFCIIRLGVAATKLPRSELVLDLKKFFSCFPGDLSSPKIFLHLVKYSSESIDSCERKAKKSYLLISWDFVLRSVMIRSGDRSESKRHLTESKTIMKWKHQLARMGSGFAFALGLSR